MGKHDEIARTLNTKKLCELLSNYFGGDEGSWSSHHFLLNTKLKDLKLNEVKILLDGMFNLDPPLENVFDMSLENVIRKCFEDNELIGKLNINNSLEISKKIEFPIIKGENKYQVTKGYLDLVVHAKPIKKGFFSVYKEFQPIEFAIEIKKKEDLKDVGSIIRQINEYREYYGKSCKYFGSEIINEDESRKTKWCLLIDEFNEDYREMFEDENIEIIDLSKQVRNLKENGNGGEK